LALGVRVPPIFGKGREEPFKKERKMSRWRIAAVLGVIWLSVAVGLLATAIVNRPTKSKLAFQTGGGKLDTILGGPQVVQQPGLLDGWHSGYTLALVFVSIAALLALSLTVLAHDK
jgi:hypothetical protein